MRVLLVLSLVTLLPAKTPSAEWRWVEGAGYRSAALPVPAAGRTGFLTLPSSTTGITFTNHLSDAAAGTENLLPRIRACIEASVTLGEIANGLRSVWGEYRP